MKQRIGKIQTILITTMVALNALAASALPQTTDQESMKDMPILRPQKTYVVTGKEDWSALTGFGTKTAEITMMNLMMIGGSGMEHMSMRTDRASSAPETVSPSPNGQQVRATITPNPPKVGQNQLDLFISGPDGKPLSGLKLQATVEMTNMDMGVAHPTVEEVEPGHYVVKPTFSMLGPWQVRVVDAGVPGKFHSDFLFDVGSKTPWSQPQPWHVELTQPLDKPQIGKNTLVFRVLNPQGEPVKGAKVQVSVTMTSMNMGTAHPKVVEKDGVYSTQVEFTMLGPWRVTLRIAPPNAKPFVQNFDFEVKAE
ncbi:YtkA [Chthonomonas calidirosea]|uniref:YtkA-like n=1 Tax=Chthonomonas calidirosea (strain DSM 23976 / ICMP 18418 / T49) TaxID=1303518 RepID=S0EZV0_CHTCT|nr:FixH family protein [Chthonomonas calidirosea]CCW36090.1 YtkA-like [Chthonomonas calidirosea T49]CEK18364.1 YtkA [Chthonomonas calidirosea]